MVTCVQSVDDSDSATKNTERDGSLPNPKHSGSGATKIGGWWEAHRMEIVNSTREVFEVVEKALDGCPIIGPKAAFGAAASVLRAVQVRALTERVSSFFKGFVHRPNGRMLTLCATLHRAWIISARL
jgi:hypothetical protein